MKKLTILFYILIGFTSCNMDKLPYGQLEENEAIKTLSDCRSYRNGLYASFRGITTGGYITYGEIQMDDFQSTLANANRVGEFYKGSLLPQTSDVETMWGAPYGMIASANFIIGKMESLPENNDFSEKQMIELHRYLGESYFARAYSYAYLADKFCAAYTANTKTKTNGGLPLITKYNPTSDNSQYQGRSTLEETYALINKDLKAAYDYLLEYETNDADAAPAAMSAYITTDVVKAMQARVALATGDYQTALDNAEELINSGNYPLASRANFAKMWTVDESSEALWRLQMTDTYNGNASGESFVKEEGTPDYVPSNETLLMYDIKNDTRFKTYFSTIDATSSTGSTVQVYGFSKYPGNPALYKDANNYKNMSKPFRIAEMYLVAAEAAANLPSESGKANSYLNSLKKARITGYTDQTLAGSNLMSEIQSERHRELIGEGFRLGDLKRWNLGFERSEGYDESILNTVGNIHRLSYTAGDHRFLWPIPKAEIDANPQIRSQQNPGY